MEQPSERTPTQLPPNFAAPTLSASAYSNRVVFYKDGEIEQLMTRDYYDTVMAQANIVQPLKDELASLRRNVTQAWLVGGVIGFILLLSAAFIAYRVYYNGYEAAKVEGLEKRIEAQEQKARDENLTKERMRLAREEFGVTPKKEE